MEKSEEKSKRELYYKLSLGKNINSETINGLSLETINGKEDLLKRYNEFWESIPKLDSPYSTLLMACLYRNNGRSRK